MARQWMLRNIDLKQVVIVNMARGLDSAKFDSVATRIKILASGQGMHF
jgi:hypothetical protein